MDIVAWFRRLALDIVGSLFLGEEIGALDQDTPHEYLINMDNHFKLAGIKWEMPWILPLFGWLPIPSWQHFHESSNRRLRP